MNLNGNNILIDTNILFGAYVEKQDDVKCLNYLLSLHKGKRVHISSLSIAQFVSKFGYKNDVEFAKIKAFTRNILNRVTIIKFEKNDIEAGLVMEQRDLEDNMQYVMGRKMKCLIFVTNNAKDFSKFATIRTVSSKNIRKIV
jgi:predicted nucleic acid-binding protein